MVDADLYLEEDSYECLELGWIRVHKDIFDDFDEGVVTLICFLDEGEWVGEFVMDSEDDNWIYFEPLCD